MRVRNLVIFALLVGGGVAAWVYFGDDIRGFPNAKSASQAADLFAKAVKERDYKTAAKYCTKAYAEQLIKGHDKGKAVGEAIDDLKSRMEQSGVSTDETKLVLFLIDPLPKAFTIATKDDVGAVTTRT